MKDMDEKLEQMVRDYYQGYSVEETIRMNLGGGIADQSAQLEEAAGSLYTKIKSLKEEYSGMEIKMAVFQEIDRQCGDDCAEQFRRISDLKYAVSMRNFALSKEIQTEQGQDTNFIEEALKKTHDMEQKMADTATPEELAALQEELAKVLPDNQEEIWDVIRKAAADEGWADILKGAEEAKESISEKAKKDFSVMAAALFLSENKGASAKEAAVAGIMQTEENLGTVDWVIICLAAASSGFFSVLLGEITGFSAFTALGFAGIAAASVAAGILTAYCAGEAAYEAAKKAVPYIKSAWEKCRPRLENLAAKVKEAVAGAFGTVKDKVFRPAIYWASNSALPVIREKVWYPLERRLRGMLEWLQQKKEQVVEFVRSAAASKDAEQAQDAEGQEKESEEEFTFEDMEELEFE